MRTTRIPRAGGFTVAEMAVVLLILSIAALIGFPALQKMIHRSKLEGYTREVSILIRLARNEAVKRGVSSVVELDGDAMVAWVDVIADDDGDGVADDPPEYDPDPAAPRGTADFEIARFVLPTGVTSRAPGALEPIELKDDAGVDAGDILILDPNGSSRASGSFRFGDVRDNYLEVFIDPPATVRVQVRKWDGADWLTPGEGGKAWEWNT